MLDQSAAPTNAATPQVPDAPQVDPRLYVLGLALALLGGLFGIGGAFLQELESRALFAVFVGALIIEEALKPLGIYILLVRWPQALRGRLHTAVLCAISGVTFGIVESLVYVL